MDDALVVVGLACLSVAGFTLSLTAGLVVVGVSLLAAGRAVARSKRGGR